MRIGFDLDEIFVTHPPFVPGWLIERLYRGKTNGALQYRIPGKVEQEIRKFSHMPFFRHPIKKNIAYVKNLTQKKDDAFFLISSRFGFLQNPTEKIVKKYGIDKIFHKIYFNYENEQPHVFKDRVIKETKITIFIDDDIYLLKYLAKENKKTQFFWLNPSKKEKIYDNLFAITNLAEMKI